MEAVQRTKMKRVAYLAGLAAVVAVAWIAWKLHPWMRSGDAVELGSWQLAGHDFQVWQRKNNDLLEAFATGLFVRNTTNQWQVFCLDFEDVYSPKIELQANGSQVAVLRSGTKVGDFDTTTVTFKRATDGAALNAVVISNAPPGDWWLKQ